MFSYLYFFAADACDKSVGGSFFGLVPWYHYLSVGANCQVFSSGGNTTVQNVADSIPLILLAVVDDLLRIAGLVAVGFVVYASIQFVTSQGDANETAKARGTIINALVGLAIALVAVVFVSYLGNHLQ